MLFYLDMTMQLFNHVSPETAYVINKFPFNFGKFTKVRYWVETNPNYGQKLVTQVFDPKSDSWFAPKHEGYHDIAIITVNDNQIDEYCGHVTPILIKLKPLDVDSLWNLAHYYVFTPFQKWKLVEWLHFRNRVVPPQWQPASAINIPLITQAEQMYKINRNKPFKGDE
jgi:hypothetical protein